MTIYADLHMHSSCSDGLDTPLALLERAKSRGLLAVSITDHDTLAALEQGRKAALELGLELVTGIEVSAFYKGRSAHLLGYFLDETSPAAKKLVEINFSGREERMGRMVSHLGKLGYNIDMDKLVEFTGEGTLGRVSLAKYMVKLGYFRTPGEAFDKALGDGRPAFEPVSRLSVEQSVELIGQAGGVSSLAHPGAEFAVEEVEAFAEAGLDAVEAITPYHSPELTAKWLQVAGGMGLAVSGGSDCHGPLWRNHNVGAAGLDFEMMEKLRARAKTPACRETSAGGKNNEAA